MGKYLHAVCLSYATDAISSLVTTRFMHSGLVGWVYEERKNKVCSERDEVKKCYNKDTLYAWTRIYKFNEIHSNDRNQSF